MLRHCGVLSRVYAKDYSYNKYTAFASKILYVCSSEEYRDADIVVEKTEMQT